MPSLFDYMNELFTLVQQDDANNTIFASVGARWKVSIPRFVNPFCKKFDVVASAADAL